MDEKLHYFISKVNKLFKMNLSDASVNNLVQFTKFGLVGISNTFISYFLNVTTLLLLKSFQADWDYIAANLVAFGLSVLWSFYWNSRYVFMTKKGEYRSTFKTLMKTYVSYGFTGIILNNILSWLWIDKLGISKYIAPLINLIVSVPLNFVINKLWAFRTENSHHI